MNIEKVGQDCFTSPKWNRDICQATRVEYGEYRFYRHEKDGEVSFRRGATFLAELISHSARQDLGLIRWRKKFAKELGGDEQVDRWMRAVADFGTESAHINYDLLIRGNVLTEAKVEAGVKALCEKYQMSQDTYFAAVEKAKKDILAFRQFNIEHEIVPFATEQMVTSKKLNLSTPIDVVCTGLFSPKKGARKTKCWAFVNLKSSENKQDHSWQCSLEYWLASETIVDQCLAIENLPIVIGTVRPKDWRGQPSFEWEAYTDFAISEEAIETIPLQSRISEIHGHFKVPEVKVVSWEGALNEGTSFTFKNIFS